MGDLKVPDSLAVSQERTENGTGVTRGTLQNESQELEMQGHLPECWCHPCRCLQVNQPCRECICDNLRACEQRIMLMRYKEIRGWQAMKEQIAYEAALDAAIAAAEDQHMYMSNQELIVTGFNVAKSEILRAIRKLYEVDTA